MPNLTLDSFDEVIGAIKSRGIPKEAWWVAKVKEGVNGESHDFRQWLYTRNVDFAALGMAELDTAFPQVMAGDPDYKGPFYISWEVKEVKEEVFPTVDEIVAAFQDGTIPKGVYFAIREGQEGEFVQYPVVWLKDHGVDIYGLGLASPDTFLPTKEWYESAIERLGIVSPETFLPVVKATNLDYTGPFIVRWTPE